MSGSLRQYHHPFIKWPTSLHLSPISVKPNLKFEGAKTQIIICLKEKSQLLSIFFNAFGVILEPTVWCSLACGFRDFVRSNECLSFTFDINSKVSNAGGACGEIVAYENQVRPYFFLGSWLFWGITAFPGAFSAYRYIALQNDITGALQKYCLGESIVIYLLFVWLNIFWLCLFWCGMAQALIFLLLTCLVRCILGSCTMGNRLTLLRM